MLTIYQLKPPLAVRTTQEVHIGMGPEGFVLKKHQRGTADGTLGFCTIDGKPKAGFKVTFAGLDFVLPQEFIELVP